MARLNSVPSPSQNPTFTNLERILARLQKLLLSSDGALNSRNQYEREKLGTNLEYARNLLVSVEQDALNIKVQARKQEVQADLVRKRELIQKLDERLQELNELGNYEVEDDTSDGEDLLAQDTPSETTDETATQEDRSIPSPTSHTPSPTTEAPASPPIFQTTPAEGQSTLRSRAPHSNSVSATPSDPNPTRAYTTSTSTSTSAPSVPTSTAETLLTHNRTEQEALTSSLLAMAQQLKASSRSFANTLESDSQVLDAAVAGMDKNELGLEAASKRMGYLRSMTEGKGWWGRMLMYANIAGLMLLALIIVFVLPKLRF